MSEKNLRDIQMQHVSRMICENVDPQGYTVYLTGTEEFIKWFSQTFDNYSEGKAFEDTHKWSFFDFFLRAEFWNLKGGEDKQVETRECLRDKYINYSRADIHHACRVILTRLLVDYMYKKSNILSHINNYVNDDSTLSALMKKEYRTHVLKFQFTPSFFKDNGPIVRALLHDIYIGFSVGAYNIEEELRGEF